MFRSRKKRVSPAAIRSAGKELTHDLVFADLEPYYNKFRQQLGSKIDAAIDQISAAHQVLEKETRTWPKDRQAQHVKQFIFIALNNLILATHFIVAGYHQAAGQQMRSFAEASAMSMLLLLPNEWKQFSEDPINYPAHKSLGRVQREANMKALEKMLSIDAKGWASFVNISKLYNHHSHAGGLTLLLAVRQSWPFQTILGGEYDRARKKQYSDDLSRAASGASTLGALTTAIVDHLKERQPDVPTETA